MAIPFTLAQLTAGIEQFDRDNHHTPDFIILNAQYLPQIKSEFAQSIGMPFCGYLPSPCPALWVPVQVQADIDEPYIFGTYFVFGDEPSPITFSPRVTTRNMEARHA